MHLRHIIIYVADVPATMEFYEAAFGMQRSFLHEGGDYGEMATGDTRLAFSAHALMLSLGKAIATSPPDRPAYEIALETGDVPAAVARAVAAGAVLVQDAEDMPWGQVTAYVRTPEGTLVELCTAVQAP